MFKAMPKLLDYGLARYMRYFDYYALIACFTC